MNSENLTILYERLSHKNGCENESLSIENQKAYLEEYAARNSFTNFVHHTDDGWSGTRWDRLGFLQMMNDIERSGLGTDTHKRYEPFRARPFADRAIFRAVTRNGGVRLIAVAEDIATAKGVDISIIYLVSPHQNLI